MRDKLSLLLGQILIAVAFLSSWQMLVTTGKLDKFFFSRPSDIAARILTWLKTGSIWPHLFVTLEEAALAFAAAAMLIPRGSGPATRAAREVSAYPEFSLKNLHRKNKTTNVQTCDETTAVSCLWIV